MNEILPLRDIVLLQREFKMKPPGLFTLVDFIKQFTKTIDTNHYEYTRTRISNLSLLVLMVALKLRNCNGLTLHVEELEVSYFVNLLRESDLEELDLSRTPIRSEGLMLILKEAPVKLRTLKLTGCQIQFITSSLLERFANIKELHLGKNPVKASVFNLVLKKLNKTIEVLNFAECDFSSNELDLYMLKECINLKVLDLSYNPLLNDGVESILRSSPKSLKQFMVNRCCISSFSIALKNLHCLEVNSNRIRNSGLITILTNLSETLEFLSVSQCEITEIPTALLTKCRLLVALNISYNSIQSRGFQQVLDCLYSQIQSLDVGSCGIEGIPLRSLQNCTDLMKLDIKLNPRIDFLVLKEAARVLPRLYSIQTSSREVNFYFEVILSSFKFRINNLLASTKSLKNTESVKVKLLPVDILIMISNRIARFAS